MHYTPKCNSMKKLFFIFAGFILLSSIGMKKEAKLKEIVSVCHLDSSKIEILIDKSDYQLTVLHKDSVLKVFPCVFGFGYPDQKWKKGDGATPEGTFRSWAVYPHPSWTYFVSLNYPTKDDKERIYKAVSKGEVPKGCSTGGSIGIHGTNPDCDNTVLTRNNWTYGCISVTNASITEIAEVLPPYWTKIVIRK